MNDGEDDDDDDLNVYHHHYIPQHQHVFEEVGGMFFSDLVK